MATKELLPQRRGEMRMVLTKDSKLETRWAVSSFRSVKSCSWAIFPKLKGSSVVGRLSLVAMMHGVF